MKQVKAVKLNEKGFVTLATLDNGTKVELDTLLYLARIGNLDGVYLATMKDEQVLIPSQQVELM